MASPGSRARLQRILTALLDVLSESDVRLLRGFQRSAASGGGGLDNQMDNFHDMFREEREEIAQDHGFRDFGHLEFCVTAFMEVRARLYPRRDEA